VENKCTSHKFILCAISVPKIIKVGGTLTKLWQKQFCTVFSDTVYICAMQVFGVCGRPTLGGLRSRRKASSGLSSAYNWHHGTDNIQRSAGHSATAASGEGLDSLVHDIHERLLTTRDFTKNLPDSVCSQLAATPFELTNCWNGFRVSR